MRVGTEDGGGGRAVARVPGGPSHHQYCWEKEMDLDSNIQTRHLTGTPVGWEKRRVFADAGFGCFDGCDCLHGCGCLLGWCNFPLRTESHGGETS